MDAAGNQEEADKKVVRSVPTRSAARHILFGALQECYAADMAEELDEFMVEAAWRASRGCRDSELIANDPEYAAHELLQEVKKGRKRWL